MNYVINKIFRYYIKYLICISLLFLWLIFLPAKNQILADNTGAKYPGTVVSSTNWSNYSTTRLGSDDSSRATNAQTSSAPAVTRNYDFSSIPDDAIINGIVVETDLSSSNANYTAYMKVRISKDGGSNWSNYTAEQSRKSTTDQIKTFGTSTDLWGLTLSSSEVKDTTNFRVDTAGRISNASYTCRVDFLRVTVYYTPTVTISGTSDMTSGTVAVAVGATAQSGKTATIQGDGTWSISDVTKPSNGDIITVWVDEADDADESTAITKYDGSGAISGMVLNRHVLSIGSDDNQSLTVTNLNQYDNDQDDNILHSANSSTLKVDDDNAYTDEKIDILSGSTLTIGSSETLTTYHLTITGTLTSTTTATYNVAGDWTNNGTFTQATSTVTLNGASAQNVTGNSTTTFYNLTVSGTVTDSVTFNISHTFNVSGTFTPSDGIITMTGTGWSIANSGSLTFSDLQISGTPSTQPTANFSISGTLTIDNSKELSPTAGTITMTGGSIVNSGTLNFYNLTLSGSVSTTSTFAITNDLINNDTLTVDSGNGVITVNGNVSGSGTMNLSAGTFQQVVTADKNFGSSSGNNAWIFYNLKFENASSAADKTITLNNGTGDIIINGTLTLGDSGTKTITFDDETSNSRNLDIEGDCVIDTKGILSAPSNKNLKIAGNYTNNGRFIANSSTVLLEDSDSKNVSGILNGNSAFNNLTINSTGNWLVNHPLEVDGVFNLNNGSLNQGANADFLFKGNVTLTSNSSFTKSSGNGKFILDGNPSQTFNDQHTTKVNLGNVVIGQSPGTTTLASDMLADSLTINDTDVFNTKGYDVTLTDFLDCQGACTLDLSDTAPNNEGDGTIITVGGNWTMSDTGTFVPSTDSLVIFNATSTGKTIDSGNLAFNDVTFNSSTGGWTIQNDNLTANDFTVTDTAASGLTVNGVILEVDGVYSIADAETANTTWTSSTLYLNSGTAYTIGSKSQSAETYSTLQVGANTDVRLWNSTASTFTVNAAGSLYSQNHANTSGDLYIWGDYHTQINDYWSYNADFDGINISGSPRQVDVRIDPSSSVTVDSGDTLAIIGTSDNRTTVSRQGLSNGYNLTVSGGTINFQYTDFDYLDGNKGLDIQTGSTVTSLDYTKFDNLINTANTDDAFITVASTVIGSSNKTITGVQFDNTDSGAEFNINRTGSNDTGYWDFDATTGTFDGEAFDGANGSNEADYSMLRWDDSGIKNNSRLRSIRVKGIRINP